MLKKVMIMKGILKAIIDVLLVALQGVDRRTRARSRQAWGTPAATSANFNSHTGSTVSRFNSFFAKFSRPSAKSAKEETRVAVKIYIVTGFSCSPKSAQVHPAAPTTAHSLPP